MQQTLEKAIAWIMSSKANVAAFRADLAVVKQQFPGLSDADMQVLKSVQEKGLNAEALEDTELGEVEAQRSYGWADTPTKRY
jgi:hypothetical protein